MNSQTTNRTGLRRLGPVLLIALGISLLVGAVLLVLAARSHVSLATFAIVFMSGPTLIGVGIGLRVGWPVLAGLVGLMLSVPLMAAFLLLAAG